MTELCEFSKCSFGSTSLSESLQFILYTSDISRIPHERGLRSQCYTWAHDLLVLLFNFQFLLMVLSLSLLMVQSFEQLTTSMALELFYRLLWKWMISDQQLLLQYQVAMQYSCKCNVQLTSGCWLVISRISCF